MFKLKQHQWGAAYTSHSPVNQLLGSQYQNLPCSSLLQLPENCFFCPSSFSLSLSSPFLGARTHTDCQTVKENAWHAAVGSVIWLNSYQPLQAIKQASSASRLHKSINRLFCKIACPGMLFSTVMYYSVMYEFWSLCSMQFCKFKLKLGQNPE